MGDTSRARVSPCGPRGRFGVTAPQKPAPLIPIYGWDPPAAPGRGRSAARPFPAPAGTERSPRPGSSSQSPRWVNWDRLRVHYKPPFYCFSPQFPARGSNSLRIPTRLCPPRSSPGSGNPQERESPWEEPGRGSEPPETEIFPYFPISYFSYYFLLFPIISYFLFALKNAQNLN